MAPGKAPCRRRSSDSGVEPDRGPLLRDREQLSALSQKKKEQRIALFLSDFDQQGRAGAGAGREQRRRAGRAPRWLLGAPGAPTGFLRIIRWFNFLFQRGLAVLVLETCDTHGSKSVFCFKAKEHIQEMKKELDSLLQTAEKAFAVELLTMPAAVRKMKRKEVLGERARGPDSDVPGAATQNRGAWWLSWKGLLCLPCILS